MEACHLWHAGSRNGADFVQLGNDFCGGSSVGKFWHISGWFRAVTSNGATLTPETNDGVGSFYMIQKQQQTLLTVNIVPNFSTGFVRGQNLELTLPYLYWNDNGVLVQVNSFEEIPPAKQQAGEYIGMEAKLNDRSTFRQCDNSL